MKTDVFHQEQPGIDDDLSTIERTVQSEYKYGFVSNFETDEAPKGLSEDIIRFISAKIVSFQRDSNGQLSGFCHADFYLKSKSIITQNIVCQVFEFLNLFQNLIFCVVCKGIFGDKKASCAPEGFVTRRVFVLLPPRYECQALKKRDSRGWRLYSKRIQI